MTGGAQESRRLAAPPRIAGRRVGDASATSTISPRVRRTRLFDEAFVVAEATAESPRDPTKVIVTTNSCVGEPPQP